MSEARLRTRSDGGTRRKTGGMDDLPQLLDALSERVIGAAIEVHRILGPGLSEKLYVQALEFELKAPQLEIIREHPITIDYKSIQRTGQRLDLLVENSLVIEAKAIERVHDVPLTQLVSYLRSGGFPNGLLINFNVPRLKDGLYSRINPSSPPRPSASSAFNPNPEANA